eukprot:TRINITY_DN898_c0_g1_i1.p1 TRINITY_DN898_c0_g1~~TRINITY_DN898_c0_g1_i1.p1  ORF type:complete len:214 (-),score=46.23 TRINITY_DN898_c0_g1_i1:280-882(-)
MATHLSLLVFAAFISQFTVEGFFYSTGYYPFGHYAPYTHSAVGYPYALPTHHHVIPAVSYSGCRNVHGALVPCAFPTPFLTAVEAPAVIEPVVEAPVEADAAAPEAAAEAAPEEAAEAAPAEAAVVERKKREAEADAEADADPYLLYGYGGHHAYPYHSFGYNHHVPYLGHGLGHHLPHLHGYYAHTGCKNYLGSTVPCL